MSAQNARRLGRARFGLLAPGVESWFDFRAAAEAAVRTIRAPAAGSVPKERVAS